MKRKSHKKLLIVSSIIGLLMVAVGLIWYNWPWLEYGDLNMKPDWDVADNIMHAPGNKIFADAIYNMEYTDFLHGEGPFTVFVPTDKAYKSLPQATKDYLGDIQNAGALRQVALYHVVKGRFLFDDILDGMTLTTVEGDNITFTKKNGAILINDTAFIETEDIVSSNGVIHLISSYLLPPFLLEAE